LLYTGEHVPIAPEESAPAPAPDPLERSPEPISTAEQPVASKPYAANYSATRDGPKAAHKFGIALSVLLVATMFFVSTVARRRRNRLETQFQEIQLENLRFDHDLINPVV